MNKPIIGLAGLFLLGGCGSVPYFSEQIPVGAIKVTPKVLAGGYDTQSVVSPYVQGDINHVQIKLFTVTDSIETPVYSTGTTPLMLDIPVASMSANLTIGNLRYSTTYRLRAYAYSDAATASLISTPASYVDVILTNNDRPGFADLPVQLIDRVFSGQATAGINVTDGQLVSNGPFGFTETP